MFSLKQTLRLAGLIFMILFIAACGNSGYTGSSSSGTTPTTAPSSGQPLVKTAQATVKGTSETVLTNAEGLTLYYLTTDTATTATCTGTCTGIWPPLLFTGTGSPTSASPLSGTLSAVADGNGNQVEYNGHPLYTYANDTAPGQANGEGVGGTWFVATPNLPGQGAPQGTSTPSGY